MAGMMYQYDVENMVKNGFEVKPKDGGDNAAATATDSAEVHCLH